MCGTWSLSLKEEDRLGMLEDEGTRRIFGPKKRI
jgi:hypothetical protein